LQDALIALERLGGDTGFKVGGQVSSFSFHRSDFGGYLPLSDQLKFQQTTGSVLRDLFKNVRRYPLGVGLHVICLGWFPKARVHGIERPNGPLLYCVLTVL
jgi:hypothetical protein